MEQLITHHYGKMKSAMRYWLLGREWHVALHPRVRTPGGAGAICQDSGAQFDVSRTNAGNDFSP